MAYEKLQLLIARHPKPELRTEIEKRLKSCELLIRLTGETKQSPITTSTYRFNQPVTGYGEYVPVMLLTDWFLLSDKFTDRVRMTGLWHEFQHLRRMWEWGPPKYKHFTDLTPSKKVTKEYVKHVYLMELEGHFAQAKFGREIGIRVEDPSAPKEEKIEPFLSYGTGDFIGVQQLRLYVAAEVLEQEGYAEYKEYLLGLALDPSIKIP